MPHRQRRRDSFSQRTTTVKIHLGTESHHRIQRRYASLSLRELFGFGISIALPRHHIPETPRDDRIASLVDTLQSLYAIRGEEVLEFVGKHEYLTPLLKAAPQQIKRFFGSDSPALEVFTDPDDDSKKLVIVIPTTLDAGEARTQLDRLREEWWRKVSLNLDPEGNLYLNLEFK